MGFPEWQAAVVFYFLALQIGLCSCRVAFVSKASCCSLNPMTPSHCIIKPERSVWESVSLSWGSSLTEASFPCGRSCGYSMQAEGSPHSYGHLLKIIIWMFVKLLGHLQAFKKVHRKKSHPIGYSGEQTWFCFAVKAPTSQASLAFFI